MENKRKIRFHMDATVDDTGAAVDCAIEGAKIDIINTMVHVMFQNADFRSLILTVAREYMAGKLADDIGIKSLSPSDLVQKLADKTDSEIVKKASQDMLDNKDIDLPDDLRELFTKLANKDS